MRESEENPLELEIRHEKAAAYFAACKKMVNALEALKGFDRSSGEKERIGSARKRVELLEEAAERVFYVVIQREAMKLWCDERFFEDYEVPEEVRKRLGPKKRGVAADSTAPQG